MRKANRAALQEQAKIFGRKLEGALSDKKLSRSELARRLWGIGSDGFPQMRSRISLFCKGRILPDAATVIEIARGLGVDPADLMPRYDLPPDPVLRAARKQYGAWLTRKMTERGISQGRLAPLCGCSQSALSFYCNGEFLPRRETRQRIESVLGR